MNGSSFKQFLVLKKNHPVIITAKYSSHYFTGYGENAIKPFSHYKSMDFLLPWQPRGRLADFLAIFNCPYPFNICTKLESYCFSGFGRVVINFFFFKFNVAMETEQWPLVMKCTNWVNNHQMIITAKYGSYHFTGKWL